MSQNPEQQGDLGSEDIFNTEELLQGHEELPLNTENVSEFPEEASIDLEDQIEESELEEVEAIEEAEGADMEVEEMTEDQGNFYKLIFYEKLHNFFLETEGTTEGDQSLQQIPKPAKKAVHNSDKLTELPLSKVKHIIKLDPEVNLVNGESSRNGDL